MKILSIFVFAGLLLVPDVAFSAELEDKGTRMRKLQRGFINVVFSPIELSNEWSKEKKKDAAIPTWVTAGGRGLLFTFGRALSGVYDILTFPFPVPANYEPLVYPELVWDHLEENS